MNRASTLMGCAELVLPFRVHTNEASKTASLVTLYTSNMTISIVDPPMNHAVLFAPKCFYPMYSAVT